MKRLSIGVIFVAALFAGSIGFWQSAGSSQPGHSMSGGGHMGRMGNMWPMEPRWQGPGPMPRHHIAMMWGIPEPYASMTNPLPQSQATLERGAEVYSNNCEACHGAGGVGDGPAGAALSPPPGNLAWLSDMPIGQWDPFIYWTVAEGGAELGTAMPAFKESLSKDEIWAVTTYIQAHLPHEPKSD